MKKWIFGIIAIAVVAAGAYLVLGDGLPWAAASETDSATLGALPVVEAADAFLAVHPPGSDPRGEPRTEAESLKDALDAYNNTPCPDNEGGGGNGNGGNGKGG